MHTLRCAGGFAIFLSAAGLLLPQDVAYLGMTADELCRLHGCRVVHFMIHDRVAFGGALLAIGALYIWLAEFPLRARAAWLWWLLLVSGVLGFTTFLLYLGYGYLDTWHGSGTLALVPFFILGMVRSWPSLTPPRGARDALGRARGLRRSANVAHDRAGFGGAIFITGLLVTGCVALAEPSRSLWQTLCVVAVVGFGAAIGIHGVVGYTDGTHVGPAVVGAVVFGAGLMGTAASSGRQSR